MSRHRVVAVISLVTIAAAGYEIFGGRVSQITRPDLYLVPDKNLADVSSKLFPERSYGHFTRAVQGIMCQHLGLSASPVCEQFLPGDLSLVRESLEKALVAGDKSQEQLYRYYIQTLLSQNEADEKVAEAVRNWRVNFPHSTRPDPRIARAARDPLLAQPKRPASGQAGVQACAACHSDYVRDYLQTAHYLSSRDLAKNAATPKANGVMRTGNPHLLFKIEAQSERLRQSAIQNVNGRTLNRTEHADIAIGSGRRLETYHSWREKQLFQLPVAWQSMPQQWCNAPGMDDGTAEFNRGVSARCLECHASWAEPLPGTSNVYARESLLLGISCERCHGPAAEHVAYHQERPNESVAQHIVHPARLSQELQLAICSQCHVDGLRRRTPPFSFSPGELLEDHFVVPEDSDRELHHASNPARELAESACFQSSESMTCTNCHDPHRPQRDGHPLWRQNSCFQCHESADCGQHRNLPVGIRDRCVDCHMPRRNALGLCVHTADDIHVPVVQRHDHRIRVHELAANQTLLAWLLAESTEPPLPSKKGSSVQIAELRQTVTSGYTSQAQDHGQAGRDILALDAYRTALRFSPADTVIRAKFNRTGDNLNALNRHVATARLHLRSLAAANWRDRAALAGATSALRQAIRANPQHSPAHSLQGLILARAGKSDEAIAAFKRAAELAPDDATPRRRLGQVLHQQGRLEESLASFHRAEELAPYNAELHVDLGTLLAVMHRLDEAEAHFRQSLRIDPGNDWGYNQLAKILIQQGRHAQALGLARRAVELSRRQNAEFLETLAIAHDAIGDNDTADVLRQRASQVSINR